MLLLSICVSLAKDLFMLHKKFNQDLATYFFKGTLMQIWKFHYLFIQKQYPENFALLIQRILELFSRKFVFFSKSRLIFKIFYCFCIFVNKHFINRGTYISKSKRCYNVKLSAYFYVRTKITLSFHAFKQKMDSLEISLFTF